MEKAGKRVRENSRKVPISAIRVMPSSLASLFVAASVGRLSHLFPRWMSSKIEVIHDITSSQLLAIFLLSQSKEMTMGQMSAMLDLTPRAITGLTVGLEKKKYIKRRRDKEDARIVWLSLSDSGKNFLKKVRPDASRKLANLFEVLTKSEQIELVRLIEKLTDNMKSQIDEK
jgi:DNA-binding MarR family transcriptional regulator